MFWALGLDAGQTQVYLLRKTRLPPGSEHEQAQSSASLWDRIQKGIIMFVNVPPNQYVKAEGPLSGGSQE